MAIAGLVVGTLTSACSSSDSDKDGKAQTGDDAGLTCATGKPVDGWEVGVAIEDLAPDAAMLAGGALFMGAYGFGPQRGPATGVHDPVYARAMVLKSGCDVVAFTILDSPGISNRVLRPIVAKVNAETGIPLESIYVGATHSHSAPDLQGLWGGVPAEYKTQVIDGTSRAIRRAFEGAAPADLVVSKGEGPNRNRRGWDLTDKELTVLDAKAKDGTRIGTLVNFAAHPVKLGMLNHLISRDFCGYTVDYLEGELDAKDRVLFFNGAQGDVSPNGGTGTDEFEQARTFGEMVGDVALGAMGETADVSSGIHRDYQTWQQEVTNVLFQAAFDGGLLDYDAVKDAGFMGIDTQTAYLRLGNEVQTVVFPGEALTRAGLAVKETQSRPFHLWLGLTTDSLGYFVPSDEWGGVDTSGAPRNDGYEETVSMGMDAADNAVRILKEAIARDAP